MAHWQGRITFLKHWIFYEGHKNICFPKCYLILFKDSKIVSKEGHEFCHKEVKSLKEAVLSVVNGSVETSTMPSCHSVTCFYLDKGPCPRTMCSNCCSWPHSQWRPAEMCLLALPCLYACQNLRTVWWIFVKYGIRYCN